MTDSPHYRPTEQQKKDAIVENTRNRIVIRPSGLEVTWGGDSRYWEKPKDKDGVFTLSQVSWLEVAGNIPMKLLNMEAKKTYKVSFKVSLKPDAFGWDGCPVYLMVKGPDGKNVWKRADLNPLKVETEAKNVPENLFLTLGETWPDSLVFGMYEIWRGRWKGGLQIHEVLIERVVEKN